MRHPRYIGSVEKSFIFCVLRLDKFPIPAIIMNVPAGVAHPVERHLAKVEVASSSLVGRSIGVVFITPLYGDVAKW